MTDDLSNSEFSTPNWPFRWSIVLALVTFPLIWVGGLVTTTDAGMAVPDWPNTYGYNLFLYPYSTWLSGPWDIFIEHGHRLLGSLAGLIAIVLVFSTFRNTHDRTLRLLALGALILVIAQGLLGGVRVLATDRFLAKVHGCVGPAFFAYTAAFATLSYRKRKLSSTGNQDMPGRRGPFFSILPVILLAASFFQLVLGANLRHIEESASFLFFRWLIGAHLVFAGLVLALSIAIWVAETRSQVPGKNIRRMTRITFGFVSLQLLLGVLTWLVKYHWPFYADQFAILANFLIIEKSMWQTSIVTAHVATGSLILVAATVLTLEVFQLPRKNASSLPISGAVSTAGVSA